MDFYVSLRVLSPWLVTYCGVQVSASASQMNRDGILGRSVFTTLILGCCDWVRLRVRSNRR